MPTKTYKPIATTTLGSNTSSVTFNSFSGYTDLVLVYSAKGTGSNDVVCQLNGDSGSNYSATRLTGSGTAAGSFRWTNATEIYLDSYGYITTANPNITIVQFMNYSNTSTYKTLISRSGNGATGVDAIVGLWRSTAAITTFTIYPDANQFATGSTFTLYGIE